MIKKRKILSLFFLFFVFSLFIISCDNTTLNNSKGQVEIIQDPVINDVEEVEGIRVISTTNVSKYLYSMIPQWTHTGAVAGSTEGMNVTVNGTEYQNYRVVEAGTSLGYFAQGKWHLILYLLDDSDNLIINDPIIDSDYYLNTISSTIKYSLGDFIFDSTKTCKLSIDNVKFDLVEDPGNYGEDKDYYLETRLKSLGDSSFSSSAIISAGSISFEKNSQGKDVVGVINNHVVSDTLPYGSYALSIVLMERKNNSYVEAGGTTFSFLAARDNCVISSTSNDTIHIYPSDYVDVGMGESGIIIDSGTSSSVSVNAYVVSGTTETLIESNVTLGNTVRFKPTVTNGPSTITNFKWFIDGVEQTVSAIDTNGYLTYKPSTAKTYTITYMFLDGTNYNTISGNYYLTVVSGT